MDALEMGLKASANAAKEVVKAFDNGLLGVKRFNFKSQICTSREQSERLLALGLKPETADMRWERISEKYAYYPSTKTPYVSSDIPAWSLHRLIEMNLNSTDTRFEVRFNQLDVKDAYEVLLAHIEWLIKEGYFNKEYLVDQATIEEHCKGVLEYLDYIRGEEE